MEGDNSEAEKGAQFDKILDAEMPPLTEKKEICAWYMFDVATSAALGIAMALPIPFLQEHLARQASCLDPDQAHLCNEDGSFKYDDDKPVIPGTMINSESITYISIAVSVLFQALCYISLGSLGDFGTNRRKFMAWSAWLGCLALLGYMGLIGQGTTLSVFLCMLLTILVSSLFGVSVIYYNAHLPLMVEETREVRRIKFRECYEVDHWEDSEGYYVETEAGDDAPTVPDIGEEWKSGDSVKAVWTKGDARGPCSEDELMAERDKLTNVYSGRGFAWGYGSSIAIIGVVFVFYVALVGFDDPPIKDNLPNIAYAATLAFVALYAGIWTYMSQRNLHDRAGPAAPKVCLLGYSWKTFCTTMGQSCSTYKNLGRFMLCYFFFSDSFTTIGSIGLLVAKVDLELSIVVLGAVFVTSTLFAGIGNIFFLWIQQKYGLSVKTMVVICIIGNMFVALYAGLIKILSEAAGGKDSAGTIAIMVVFAVVYGSLLGASQSFCRSMFSLLVPKGHEAEFFSFYEISDRGSSWLGPSIAAIFEATLGESLYVTIYIGAVLLFSIFLIYGVELKREIAVESPDDIRKEHAEEVDARQRQVSVSTLNRQNSKPMPTPQESTEQIQMDIQTVN